MKTILRILVILLVAAAVAGSLTVIVNNTTLLSSGPAGAGEHFQAMTGTDGQTAQRPVRPEGGDNDRGTASIGQGLSQVLVTLAKLAVIVLIVLLIEKGFRLLPRRMPKPAL